MCIRDRNRRVPTDKRTHTHTDATKRIIAPAARSIIKFQELAPFIISHTLDKSLSFLDPFLYTGCLAPVLGWYGTDADLDSVILPQMLVSSNSLYLSSQNCNMISDAICCWMLLGKSENLCWPTLKWLPPVTVIDIHRYIHTGIYNTHSGQVQRLECDIDIWITLAVLWQVCVCTELPDRRRDIHWCSAFLSYLR